MKTDRELLDLAALAAGLVYEHPGFAYPTRFKERVVAWHPVTSGCDKFEHIPLAVWNPLSDDGDALRLAVTLDLIGHPRFFHERDVLMLTQNTPKLQATRRAIVLAAAEIGSAMLAANEGSK